MSQPPAKKARIVVAKAAEQIPLKPVDGKITTVYWDICGLGQVPRYALAIAGVDYVDVRIDAGEAGTDNYKQLWMTNKPKVAEEMAFPNLPYLLDEDGVAFAESGAILRYLGRKYNLMGKRPHLVDEALDKGGEFDNKFTGASYAGGLPALKELVTTILEGWLENWTKYIGKTEGPFLTGDSVTVADLKVYETLRKIRIMEKEADTSVLAKFPAIGALITAVEAVPKLREYMASDDFLQRPLNNPHAKFR